MSVARPREPMTYWYRYAHGDEAIFVHEGTGTLESQFGTLTLRPWRLPGDSDRRDLADRCPSRRRSAHARRRERGRAHRAAAALHQSATGSFSKARRTAERDIRPPDALVTARRDGRVRSARQGARTNLPLSSTRTIRWTSSGGTVTSGRSRSTSATSSRSPAACISRRRCIRRSRARASSCARSCRGCSTTTRCRSRRRTTTPTSIRTR